MLTALHVAEYLYTYHVKYETYDIQCAVSY